MDTPLHSKQQTEHGIHTPIAFIYTDTAQRVADTGFDDSDLNKVAKQIDTDPPTLWLLDTVSPPSWVPFGSSGASTDELVKTTAIDSTANYLFSKFLDSSDILWSVQGGLEQQMQANIVPNSSAQQVEVAKGGSLIGTRKQINLIEGSNVTLTVADNAGTDAVDVTVASTGGGGGTDQYVKIDAADTTAAYLDSKLLVALGLTKTIGNVAANETLTLSLPTGATNNTFRYTGSLWAADTRLISKGSAAASGNGAVEIAANASDTATSSFFSTNSTTDPTKYAIKATATAGASGLSVISSAGTGAYIETTTGNAQGLMVKSDGGGSADAVYVQKNAASGTGTFLHFDNMTAGTIMDFPSDGSIRFWGVGGAAGSTQIKPATTFSGTITWTLPTAQGAANTFLKNDGSGVLSWATSTSPPGGSDTQVQWNNAGAFGGISGVTTNGSVLTALGVTGTSTFAGTTSINVTGTSSTLIGSTAGANTVSIKSGIEIKLEAAPSGSSIPGSVLGVYAKPDSGTPGTGFGSAVTFYADSNTTANQQVGALQYVWTTATHATRTGAADIRLTGSGTTNQLAWTFKIGSVQAQSGFGTVLTLAIPAGLATHTLTLPAAQGAANSYLRNDGSGGLTWVSGTTTNAAGSDTYVQFNDGGTAFGGSAGFTWNKTTPQLTVAATVVFNSAGGKAMTFGAVGTNLGGSISIPANGSSSVTMRGCTTATAGQGLALVSGDAGGGNNHGGTISILTGTESGTGHGGDVTVNTGGNVTSGSVSISTNTTTTGGSGTIAISTGQTASSNSGQITISTGGCTGTAGNTGAINLTAGNSGATSGVGGSITLQAGQSFGTGNISGSVNIYAAIGGGGNNYGGSVTIQAGGANGTGNGGDVTITPGGNGSGGTYGKVRICNTSGQFLSFYGATGSPKPSAYTQTYATTTRTLTKANAVNDIGNLTISAAYSQAEVQALRNQCEILASDVRILTNFVNSILDDQQAYGLL